MEEYIRKQVGEITKEEVEILKAFAIELEGEIMFLPSTTIGDKEMSFEDVLSSLKIPISKFNILT